MKYLEVCLQTSIFAPLFNRKRISLDYGVMVAQQVLVLFVQVRILVVQQSNSLEDTTPRKIFTFAGVFVAFSEKGFGVNVTIWAQRKFPVGDS